MRRVRDSQGKEYCESAFLFASGNQGKFIEVRGAAERFGLKAVAPSEFLLTSKNSLAPLEEAEESADSYAGNAQIKADAAFAWCHMPSIADDAGLEISALQGRPGVRSARYAGEPCNMTRNIEKVLSEMKNVPDRSARFVCSLFARISPTIFLQSAADLSGTIAEAPRGGGGFGYDCIFIPAGQDRTLAEIKNAGWEARKVKTHRELALEKLLPELHRFLTGAAPRTER